MINTFLIPQALLLLHSGAGVDVWKPTQPFLFCVLFFGALLFAGVALSVFSFYEDHYWGDENFREQLRVHPSRRKSQA